jgi:hypothetical protein
MLRRVALVRTDVSEELSASFIRVTRIGELEKQKTNKLRGSYSASELATATCRRNLVPTFVDRGVLRGQRGGSPTVVKTRNNASCN